MLIGGIDVETTGLDCKKDEITEVGLVIWDTERNGPVWMSSMLRKECKAPITDEIFELTGIDKEMLLDFGEPDEYIQEHVTKFSNAVECYMAHNAMFDYGFMTNKFKMVDKTWIDSASHIEFPKKIKTRSLNSLAYDHSFINPWPHRAVTDVLTMLKIATQYNVHQMKELAKQPKLVIKANVSFADNFKAKRRGFYWYPEQKSWIKTIAKSLSEDFLKELDFEAKVLKEIGPLDSFS